MRIRKNSLLQRMMAVGLAASMVLTTPFSAFAENVTEEYKGQEIGDSHSFDVESVSEDEETKNIESEIQTYNVGTTETKDQVENTEDIIEEPSTEEVHLSLELVEEESLDDQPTLELTKAVELSKESLKLSDNTIEVKDGTGLILLSNVKPDQYCTDHIIKLATTAGWDLTQVVTASGNSYSFLGLGSESYPYEGEFWLDKDTLATQYSISTVKALFNVLSTKAILSTTIPFSISSDNTVTKNPLLAEKLITDSDKTHFSCDIALRKLNSDKSDVTIGGLIGTIEKDASAAITFENEFENSLTVSGKDHIGLFCNTMKEGASLTATFTNKAGKEVNVETNVTGKDAGGFVGYMEKNARLIISGQSVNKVTSDSGNAGGIVGNAIDGSIQIKEGEAPFEFAESLTLTAGSANAAGGLIGSYSVSERNSASYDLSSYKFGSVNISGGKNVGGLFGVLENISTNASTISIRGGSANDNSINVTVNAEVTDFGGLIGSYQAKNMASSLSIAGNQGQSLNVISKGGDTVNSNSSYGGLIGEISENSYVEIENVSVITAKMKDSEYASFGGLVGKINDGLINVGSVTLKTADNNDLSDKNDKDDKVDGRGGLVGHLVKGVLRLHGVTDLSEQRITVAYNDVGQIVGKNENGLVYALGDGNRLTDNGAGWSLKRYSDENKSRSGSDIGNWGAVVRLGTELTEDENGAFTFDADGHSVTVNNGDGTNISNTNAFVAYALAFDISTVYTTEGNVALKFMQKVDSTAQQKVMLTGNIDLTGTGIIGIGKDIEDQNFSGTFNGGEKTIKLDIGTTYGVGISENDNAAGQLYAKRSNQQDAHYSLALIPFAKNATIQNVTIVGNVNGRVPQGVTQADSEDDIRYPAFVSAGIGFASDETTFKNVTVNAQVSVTEEDITAQKLNVWQSGFLGRYDTGTSLTFDNCTWENDASLTDERDTDNHRIGGFAAEVMGGCTVTVENSIISGSITVSAAVKNAYVGGLIAVSRGETPKPSNSNEYDSNPNTMKISNLKVNGERINVTATETSGGLLGYQWQETDVTFNETATESNYGVTVSGSTLNARNAQFGGLVYLATGYWNATAAGSIVFAMDKNSTANSFTGMSTEDNPSGLLIGEGLITKTIRVEDKDVETVPSALYLEVGTYGKASDTAYQITDSSAVILSIKDSEYFDELVGITKYDDTRDRNAVVSIAVRNENGEATLLDNTQNNTYTHQTEKHYKNSKTRYYYNLDAYRSIGVNFGKVTDEKSLVLWSVSQYAANTIKKYFWVKANPTGPNTEDKQTDVTINGNINLAGYSYYPVTPLGTVTLKDVQLTFDNETIETAEENNKRPSDSGAQHYLMHHGLLYNANYNVNVSDATFSGTVGKESVSGENIVSGTYNSGALIFGTASGDPTKNPVEINLNSVVLAGIRVINIKESSINYAPLLINKIYRSVKLTVDTLYTEEGYTYGDEEETYYAATSLIGNVGSKDATKLTLSFSNIALDGRVKKDDPLSKSVYNNGDTEVNYYTTHTIFTRATLLEKFQYIPGEGSGVYNFNSTDERVTYGVELTNTANKTGLIGRNPDKQYEYYDGGYICDEMNAKAEESYVKRRYESNNFIRYVYRLEDSSESLFELDINQRATGLLEGCGTYGDPYIITDGEQLISLAAYIKDSATVNDFQVVFNSKVFEEKKQTSASYHNRDRAVSDATGSDAIYKWENGKWLDSENKEQSAGFTETATQYLLNAYYEIASEITISDSKYTGLGTIDNPFSGVIVGQNQNTVKVSCTGSRLGFGGLIAYSRGSVVKDLILDYSKASIIINNTDYPGTYPDEQIENYPFFGGVVGYCMGGDTVIDQVSVTYGKESISFSGDKAYLISAGGYVGLVGGAKELPEIDNGYEKNGGGVVFRNMNSTTNNFGDACTEALADNKVVNDDGTTTGTGTYFYRNPYVGRVLDGYVCSEKFKIENTDKNYTIPILHASKNDLQVTKETDDLNVIVNSAQGLWLLSAIVNSGAGAMSSDGTYADVGYKTVDAYQIGKPRTASYENIGKEVGDNTETYLADERYWGGVVSTGEDAKDRVSYLVTHYTGDTNAAYITGKSSTANKDTNTPVKLTFLNDIDMEVYGNGFRGIGSSYGNNIGGWQIDYSIPKVYRRNLLIKSINAENTKDITITLKMNQSDYYDEYKNGSWRNQGAGLFVDFHFIDGCTVNHLKISGVVKAGIFDTKGLLTYLDKYVYKYEKDGTTKEREEDVGVGGFAARTANSWGKVTFSNFHLDTLRIYGGTSTGGVIGYVDFPGGNTNTGEDMIIFGASGEEGYQPWSINNVKVLENINNNGSSGGLVGWFESGRTLKVIGYGDNTGQNITDLTVTTNAQNVRVATAGGLVGALDFGSVDIKGVNAQRMNISGKKLRDLGGLVAGGRQKGSITIENCILDTISIDNSEGESASGGVGGVLGFHETKNATISGVEIKGNSSISGLIYVGGFVGRSNQTITIENCKEDGANISAKWNDVGGFIGMLNSNATIKNSKESMVNILASQNAGGLIGNISGGNGASISNIELSSVMAVTKANTNCAGILVGWANNKAVKGYNILASNCKAGCSSGATFDNLSTAELEQTNICGFWIGESASGGSVNLVAVSAKGKVFPQCDVGSKTAGTVSIVYADKSADKDYQPTSPTDKPYTSSNPWLDVNPKSNVLLGDGTVMTGNGVGVANGTEVAKNILQEINTKAADRYWNLKEESNGQENDQTDGQADAQVDDQTNKPFSQFLKSTNDAYVTTYRTEEGTTTTVNSEIEDFSILVVNNSAEVDTMLWNYIAAMTNVESGDVAKKQKYSISATTYKWNSENSQFDKQESSSLNVNESDKISIVPGAYDNQNSQFTLLDITYEDPTYVKKKETDEPHLFHLYIPVLVKKVLYINFKTRFLVGTDYCASDYPMNDTSNNHYATAGFDEPVTAYMEYSYDNKSDDWQSMLDNGENLLWNYDKVLNLVEASTEDGKALLPNGTRLTLVDRQSKQYYTYTITGEEDLRNFNLSQMKTPGDSTAFVPIDICDLLDLNAGEPVSADKIVDGTTYYVVETDLTKATVRIGTTYYRKAENTDAGDKYHITVTANSEAKSESYYLTIQIPTTEGYNVVNNRLNYATFSRKEGMLPATIKSDSKVSGSSYVIYNGVEQTFTVSTNRVHNGSNMGDTIMENGDSIKIVLQSKLKLTEAGRNRFATLGPAEFYHQFDVNLMKYLRASTGEYNVIGTENITYQYTLVGNGLEERETGTISDAAGLETLTLQYGSNELKKALEKAVNDSKAVIVTAEITLTYVGTDYFPERNISDSADNSGISVAATSRIANTSTQLPITTTKFSTEDRSRYYTANSSKAVLTYSTVDGTGIGDTTQQLGINPSDEENNLLSLIYTRADYDYSNVEATILAKATQIRYTIELFQKNESGIYDETAPLAINGYLQDMTKDSGVLTASADGKSYQCTESFTSSNAKHVFTRIRFAPLTGEVFEQNGYTYANYKVRLTVALLDAEGKELDGTKVSDYIIYTNARIYQQILGAFTDETSGNTGN